MASTPAAPRRPGSLLPLVALAIVTIAGCWWWFLTRRDPDPPARPSEPGGISATPLRAAEGGETPRFRRLSPAACGLDFTNVLKKENTYQYLTNGAGLAVGDYDGDGLPDVYLVSQDGPNRLFRQKS